MNRALRGPRNANINKFSSVFETSSLWWKRFKYSRYFCNQEELRNSPPLNHVSIMLEHSTGQFPPIPPLSTDISDRFTCRVASFTRVSGISSIPWSLAFAPVNETSPAPLVLSLQHGLSFHSVSPLARLVIGWGLPTSRFSPSK